MPSDDPPVMRGLAEQLVMPKAHRAAKQLGRRNCECRVPQQIVETCCDPPRAQSMEQNVVGGL